MLLKADGTSGGPADLQEIQQTLNLWTGTVTSSFKLEGVPVEVTTCCHPKLDLVAVRLRSPLMATGRLNVFWRFPYVESDKCNPTWSADMDGKHHTEIVLHAGRADLTRTLDADRHHVSIAWNAGQWTSTGPHQFALTPDRKAQEFEFVFGFGAQPMGNLPNFTETANAAAEHWPQFWNSGGAIDLSESKDPRWHELERRIVFSQYLTAANSTGSTPPQESGLFSNSWYGKFHLEMTLWHGAHFCVVGTRPLLSGWMKWFRRPGLESAQRQAAKQNYRGARWMKMVSPEPKWESPSNQNPSA